MYMNHVTRTAKQLNKPELHIHVFVLTNTWFIDT